MDIPREPYFKKEIDVVISRSYGPGRYDPFYEEAGNDYPFGYVRFTEQRNMQAFLDLVHDGKLDIKSLISHRFKVDQAAEAYSLIEGKKTEPYLGIVLEYDIEQNKSLGNGGQIEIDHRPIDKNKIGISFLGAGNYATATLLPILKANSKVEFRGLATASGRTAQGVAKQFGFKSCMDKFTDLLSESTDVVMVTTRHDTHADAVVQALESKKHVYVEKPLAMSIEQLSKIHSAYSDAQGAQIMTGYNRRFSPLTEKIVEFFSGVKGPKVVNIRVNAGAIPDDHWIQDPVQGGGRMIGEGCHFIDLASALTNSLPSSVYAIGSRKPSKSPLLNDNLSVNVMMQDGSIANIIYTADGSKAMPKEYVEVFGGGRSATMLDFKEATFYEGDTHVSSKKLSTQDKGQKNMLEKWLNGLMSGVPCLDYNNQMFTALASILTIESLTIDQPLSIDLALLE